MHWTSGEHCRSLLTSLISGDNSDSEITETLHDSNLTTCISPMNKAGDNLYIMFHAITERVSVNFKVLGEGLQCSPLMGMNAFGIGPCVNDDCDTTPCTASDVNSSQNNAGCKYQCRCASRCSAVIIQVEGVARSWEICEIAILIWISCTEWRKKLSSICSKLSAKWPIENLSEIYLWINIYSICRVVICFAIFWYWCVAPFWHWY